MAKSTGRGFLRINRGYRTYNNVEKDPAIDEARTIVQDVGLFKNLKVLSEISGVSQSTYRNWWHGDTRRPTNAALMATITACGYQRKWVREKELDIEAERIAAAKWREKQDKLQGRVKKKK